MMFASSWILRLAKREGSFHAVFGFSLCPAILLVAATPKPVQAFTVFSGVDVCTTCGGSTRLSAFPNSLNASNNFQSILQGNFVQTFDNQTTFVPNTSFSTNSPIVLSFPDAAGPNIIATLGGAGPNPALIVGAIRNTPGTTTNGFGRYSISNNQFLEVPAGGTNQFQISVSRAIAVIGFYGVDIGDFGGSLTLELFNGATSLGTRLVPSPTGSSGSTDGSILFYGIATSNPAEVFDRVVFNTTIGTGDVFAFDNLSIASLQQVVPTPAPAAGALFLLGVIGRLRRRYSPSHHQPQ